MTATQLAIFGVIVVVGLVLNSFFNLMRKLSEH